MAQQIIAFGRSLALDRDYLRDAGLVLLFGSSFQFLHKAFSTLWNAIKQRLVVSLEIDSKDESYQWFMLWLSEHPYAKKATRLSLATVYESDAGPRPRLLISPALGNHFLRYNGNYFWINRNRDSNATDLTNGGFFETIRITLLGRNRNAIQNLIKDAMDLAYSKDEGKIVIYVSNGGHWSKFASRGARKLDSVILEQGLKDKVVQDVHSFLNNSQWYRDLGIPYRRGYLFYGFPGSGKTSFIYALAGELAMNICIVNLSNGDLDDNQLNSLLNNAPSRSILLIEDVDAAFVQRSADGQMNAITFSGLLNALDGVAAQEGRLLFMTTNKVEALDPALIRPGRVDMQCYFGLASKFQVGELFQRFYHGASADLVARFQDRIPEQTVTMAELQNYLLSHRDSPESAINDAEQFLNTLESRKQRVKAIL